MFEVLIWKCLAQELIGLFEWLKQKESLIEPQRLRCYGYWLFGNKK